MKLTVNRIVKNWNGASKIKYTTTGFVENTMGPGRRFAKQNIDNELWEDAFKQFNLTNIKKDPFYGNILMNHYKEDAFTHIHQDESQEGHIHVRANVMLKKPEEGGDIIIDDNTYQIEVNDLWLVLASMEKHGSTPIKNGERLLFSFGASVPEKEVEKILQCTK